MSDAGQSPPGAGLVVREGGPEDLAAVIRIEQRSFGDPWSPESLLSELMGDRLRLPLVAERGGELVGFLMAWRVADQLHILNLASDPRCLRQGIGTALLREAARRGLAAGLVEATLEVRRSNVAGRAFYRHHGFREVGLRKRYYADNGEDALVLDCALDRLAAL